jgi:hypothetical protein
VNQGGKLLHLRWIFLLTFEGAIGSAIGVDSGPYNLVLVYRFLSKDHSRLMWWLSYVGMPDTVAYQPSAWICHLSESLKRFARSGGACLSPLYTSNRLFSKSCHLAIFGCHGL